VVTCLLLPIEGKVLNHQCGLFACLTVEICQEEIESSGSRTAQKTSARKRNEEKREKTISLPAKHSKGKK